MTDKKPYIMPRYIIHGVFTVGLLSAVLFRSLLIIQRFEPAWVRPTWYAAIMGYLLFFLYRFRISRRRKRVIEQNDLIRKINDDTCLEVKDKEALTYLLTSIKVSPEDMNYVIIFALSLMAIGADIVLGML